jgi:hemerythrin
MALHTFVVKPVRFDQADAQRLVDFVDQWLADHIGRIDVQPKPCVEDSQP